MRGKQGAVISISESNKERPPRELAGLYAARLLATLGRHEPLHGKTPAQHPAIVWARSGLMAVTGFADGPPLMAPAPLTACADGALLALQTLGPGLEGMSGASLLGERARYLKLTRQGRISPGGACHLLRTADGDIAVSLARDADWACVPAWLTADNVPNWPSVANCVATFTTAGLLDRARLLGLAVADCESSETAPGWCEEPSAGPRQNPGGRRPLVLDLTALWAGPLCGDLLGRLGATVVKLESRSRPDGARLGNPAFYQRLNGGKPSVSLDLSSHNDRGKLAALLSRADIVLESARPRALRQLGISAESWVARGHGRVWLSITGYGRNEPQADWIAFGDDAAAAAGLSARMQAAHGTKLFCGDALADPLTGIHAALAAWSCWLDGGGRLLSVSLQATMAHALKFDETPPDLPARTREWTKRVDQTWDGSLLPLPPPRGPARPLGADNAAWLGATTAHPC